MDRSRRIAERADALVEVGRPHLAIPLLRQALQRESDDVALLGSLATALEASGYLGEALEVIERAISIEPEYAWLHHVRGWVLYRSGRPLAAIDASHTAVELDPWNLDTMVNLAWMLSSIGSRDALAVGARAVAMFPDRGEAWNAKHVSELSLGRPDLAERSARKALSLAPSEAAFHVELGWALALQRRFEDALSCFQRAAQLEAERTSELAFCLRALGRRNEATAVDRMSGRAYLARIDELVAASGVSTDLMCERGWVLARLNRNEEALSQFLDARRAAQSPAEDIAALRGVINQQLVLHRDTDAVQDAWSLISDDLEEWNGCEEAALVGWLTRDADVASAALEVANLVETPQLAAQALGYGALSREDWGEAHRTLSEAIRLGHARRTCCEHVGLALAQLKLGETPKAHESFAFADWLFPVCPSVRRFRETFAA